MLREERKCSVITTEGWKREGKRAVNLYWSKKTEGLKKEFSKQKKKKERKKETERPPVMFECVEIRHLC